jgi:hypothetical protein
VRDRAVEGQVRRQAKLCGEALEVAAERTITHHIQVRGRDPGRDVRNCAEQRLLILDGDERRHVEQAWCTRQVHRGGTSIARMEEVRVHAQGKSLESPRRNTGTGECLHNI